MMRKCMIIMALLVPVVLLPTFSWGGNSILVSLKSPNVHGRIHTWMKKSICF